MQQVNPVVDDSGANRWYNKHGQIHRVGGPAMEFPGGIRMWYQNGQLHRLDGAAIEHSNGNRFWFINGNEYSEQQFQLVAFVMSQVAI